MQGRNRGKLHHIIVLAEGVGNAYEIANQIIETTDTETKVTILGHIQRGGTPTSFDRILASEMGRKAIELLLDNKSGRALGIKCNNVIDLDITEALNAEKVFDLTMYNNAKILSI
jgi:6-phosphofructokinase 1